MKIERIRKELLDKAMQSQDGKVEISAEDAIEIHIALTEIGKFISGINRWEKEEGNNHAVI
jgi:hypothetical protein